MNNTAFLLNNSKKAVVFINRELKAFDGKTLSKGLERNICFFQKVFKDDIMLRIRKVTAKADCGIDTCLLFMDGMVKAEIINEAIIKPLAVINAKEDSDTLSLIEKSILCANEVKKTKNIKDMLSALLYGDSVLLCEGSEFAFLINTKGWRTRGISEPVNEQVSQGPREGFDEAVMFNAAMLRRRLATPDLCVRAISVGRKTDTKVFIFYLHSLVNKRTLCGLINKINKIDIDGILDTNYLNELVNKNRLSFFKTAGSTERPDIVAARLLEGRIAVIADGSPVALTLPYIYTENFQSDDDYYTNFTVAAIGRALRYLCFYLAIALPAIYIALINFHPELLPVHLLTSVAYSRSGVPFPSYLEMLLLILIFEILKETGARMQQNQGGALSIVGGLVIGQAAVEARFVSAPAVIIAAFCGIAGICVPRLKGAVFYFKVLLLACSSLLGLFGFFAGFTLMHIHLYSLESFGVSYVAPANLLTSSSLKDTVFRVRIDKMKTRPSYFTKNMTRFKYKK